MAKIGFIGLGHMGAPMAINCLRKGHQVIAFDLMPEAMQKVAAAGAQLAHDVSECADDVDVVITVLQTGEQVKEVCQKIFKNMARGTLYLDCSTIAVTDSRAIHHLAQKHHLLMCDAPVSGGVAAAEVGSLTFMVGGHDEAFETALPILKTMGKNIIHAGHAGNGQVAKTCNNMILGVSMIAVSEAFVLAEKLGLDAKTFFAIASKASGQCWSMTSYCPVPGIVEAAPSNRNYEPGFSAAMMLKDLKLSQAVAHSEHAATPMGELAEQLYQRYVDTGHANVDFSGIIKTFEDVKE